jgi:class 3 adenylate cyclase
MSAEIKKEIQLEIAYVLFIDVVGYSKVLITEQSELLRRERALAKFEIALSDVVRETEQFRSAEVQGKLVRLPTGDGMALVFRDSPEAPVLCALELSKKLKAHPELSVRMGIHSGPVNEVAEVNERTNITGTGINVAQGVMDCGGAGHILVSKRVADDLEQYRQWGFAPPRPWRILSQTRRARSRRKSLHGRTRQPECAGEVAAGKRNAKRQYAQRILTPAMIQSSPRTGRRALVYAPS